MTITIPSIYQWQALRKALRAYKVKKQLSGEELRPAKNQLTRTGEFLEKLVAWGLLKVVKESTLGPLDCLYQITAAGGRAAEYGEWDGDPFTWKALPVIPKKESHVLKKEKTHAPANQSVPRPPAVDRRRRVSGGNPQVKGSAGLAVRNR